MKIFAGLKRPISLNPIFGFYSMALQSDIFQKTFQFTFKARTSRGLMKDKSSWFIRLWDESNPAIYGIGECGPLKGLSPDFNPEFETILKDTLQKVNGISLNEIRSKGIDNFLSAIVPPDCPSLLLGLETAILDLVNGGKRIIFENSFVNGTPIPINGLIWMGDLDFMMSQINQKVAQGFRCIKLKVGGLDFDRECDILQYIRKRYFRENIEIRLDANGAFKIDDVLYKLTELAKFGIQSIEQPLKAGLAETEELCRKSPIPVGFDEELIGIYGRAAKENLLQRLKPQFVILKPTLHGGFTGCKEWIEIAEGLGIGWWITSALESNVGLNAIAQFTASYPITIPQGLGTGMIYENNFESPLLVKDGFISYDNARPWAEALG
jgi:o-succinylbenzoate synthase